MINRYWLTAVCCLMLLHTAFGQLKLQGKIVDAVEGEPLPFVSVVLYEYQSNKIIDYTQSDNFGNYKLTIEKMLTVATLKTSRLGYQPFQRDIVIGDSTSKSIELQLILVPNTKELQEVVINGPVIVKKDTVIYDVTHWTDEHDQTLEVVLAKIPGFKVRGDGEIEIEGKVVRKVLVDGKEISDGGAALITRSISPEDVESIEVRFDEKSNKLIESLLDATEYVVIDIKLTKQLNQSLFGKIRGTMGYQHGTEPGGYLNAFSLKKRSNLHLFAEHDHFGEQTISLSQLRNLGAEASRKLFETPANFQELTERERFSEEIYGFKDYTTSSKDILGISNKYTISPSIDLYVGSYNSYDKQIEQGLYVQELINDNINNTFADSRSITDYSTKNKLDFRLDRKTVKVRFDLNAVVFRNSSRSGNLLQTRKLDYEYSDIHYSQLFAENFLAEYTPTAKFAIQLKASHAIVQSDHEKQLLHSDSLYTTLLIDEDSQPVFHLNQESESVGNQWIVEMKLQQRSKFGIVGLGSRLHDKQLDAIQTATNGAGLGTASVPFFSGEYAPLRYTKSTLFAFHRFSMGDVSLNYEARWVGLRFPFETISDQQSYDYEYAFVVDYSQKGKNIAFTIRRNITPFPLTKRLPGAVLMNFQQYIAPTTAMLSPKPEYTAEITGNFMAKSYGLTFDPGVLYGQLENGDRFLFTEGSPLVSSIYDQLRTNYWLLTFPLIKTFKKFPLKATLEPEWVINVVENRDEISTSNYATKTNTRLLGLKLNTLFDDKPYDFFLYPKHTTFTFENEQTITKNAQNLFSLDASLKLELWEKRMMVQPTVRVVRFYGLSEGSYANLGLTINYKVAQWYVFLTSDNLLNDLNFTKQSIFPTYFINEQSVVFSRWAKLGVSYKFK